MSMCGPFLSANRVGKNGCHAATCDGSITRMVPRRRIVCGTVLVHRTLVGRRR